MTERVAVRFPDLGIREAAQVTGWLVDPGETVDADDPLLEVRVLGIVVSIPAPWTGTVSQHAVPIGRRVKAGDVVAWIVPAASTSDGLAD